MLDFAWNIIFPIFFTFQKPKFVWIKCLECYESKLIILKSNWSFLFCNFLFQTRGHLKFPTHRHSWPMTKKLSFKVCVDSCCFVFPLHCQACYWSYWALLFNLNKSFATHLFQKKKFFIEPRGNPELPKMTFYTNHYKK